MNTSIKLLSTVTALAIITTLGASSVFAKGHGQGGGQGQGMNNQEMNIDANGNGTPDGQEDFDNDGILNKDDADYDKTGMNMHDDDGDGIPNKDDSDYDKTELNMNNKDGGKNEDKMKGQGKGKYSEKAIKSSNYKKFTGELKEKKNFSDKNRIKNQDAVSYLQERGIINGYEDGSFNPENSVNRAEALKIILEALGEEVTTPTTQEFTDVPVNQWFAGYVSKAKEKGIIKGYSDGSFGASKTVSKVELLKILIEAFEIDLSSYPVSDLYEDASLDAWFASYLQYAKDNNLVDADANGNINPSQGMTRDEFSEVVYRLLQQQENI